MDNVKDLQKDQSLIDEYIRRLGNDRTNDNVAPIYDGVINPDLYLNSKIRIAWVLKEPYDDFDDDGNPYGGDWSISDIYYKTENVYDAIKQNPTLNTMAYTTYGILNNKMYEDMDWISDNPEIANSLRSIVHMNINKFPGFKTTAWGKLYSEYEYWRPILLFQLKVYSPQIIIFGNTLNFFERDLGVGDCKRYDSERNLEFAICNGCLLINAYHPGQRTIKKEDYINGIISLLRENINELSLPKS